MPTKNCQESHFKTQIKMKKYILPILVTMLLCVVTYIDASTLWYGSLTTVNNTTAYSPTNSFPVSLNASAGNYLISDGGLTALTALAVNMQLSLDSNNWLTVASWTPSVTNSGTFSWSPGVLSQTVYQRFQFVTTNSVGVGVLQP
jgi:hypothetical protein